MRAPTIRSDAGRESERNLPARLPLGACADEDRQPTALEEETGHCVHSLGDRIRTIDVLLVVGHADSLLDLRADRLDVAARHHRLVDLLR